jgi:hypothetical protein
MSPRKQRIAHTNPKNRQRLTFTFHQARLLTMFAKERKFIPVALFYFLDLRMVEHLHHLTHYNSNRLLLHCRTGRHRAMTQQFIGWQRGYSDCLLPP